MFELKKTLYGVSITVSPDLTESKDIRSALKQVMLMINEFEGDFSAFTDLRNFETLPLNVQELIVSLKKWFSKKGMKRSVVILNSAYLTEHFKHYGRNSGLYEFERYLDTSFNSKWKLVALDWVMHGIEPSTNFQYFKDAPYTVIDKEDKMSSKSSEKAA